MEKFSDEFRKRYEKPELLDKIETTYHKLVALKRPKIYIPELLPGYREKGALPLVPVKVLILYQMAIRRASELADSMIRDASAFTYTPVWTSARSIFELAALVFDMKERIRPVLMKWDEKAYYEFSEHIDAVLLGFKSPEWHPKSEERPDMLVMAKNILGMVDRIAAKQIPPFRSMYDLLSEVAHPNYMGMMEQYHLLHDDKLTIEFIDDPVRRDPTAISIPLDAAHGTLEMLASSIAEYDGWLPEFVKLCEKHVPKTGASSTQKRA